MKVLITGHNGFIGKALSNVIENFIGIDGYYTQDFIIDFLNTEKPNIIFHVGACSDTLCSDVPYMMHQNYLSTKTIIDWCVQNDCKMIYSSSASCYGVNGLHPSNLYGWSKYIAEQYVISNGGLALRYFNVYGYDESHKGRMASFIYQNHKKDSIGLFTGNPSRDFVYIDDVISANLFALDNYDSIKGSFFDVGYGQPVTYEAICNILGKEFYYLDDKLIPNGYQFYTKANSKNFIPNWKPKYNIQDGISKYMDNLNGQS